MLKGVYKNRTATTINCESIVLKEFQELCSSERRSLSEKIGELMLRELDRNKHISNS